MDNYEILQEISGVYGLIKAILMLFVPEEYLPVETIVALSYGLVADEIENSRHLTAMTRNRNYYKNKVGCVQFGSTWAPIAYVGERRIYAYEKTITENEDGIVTGYVGHITTANSLKNPTNYDDRDMKPHYNDNTWIINKALETCEESGYVDVYALVFDVY